MFLGLYRGYWCLNSEEVRQLRNLVSILPRSTQAPTPTQLGVEFALFQVCSNRQPAGKVDFCGDEQHQHVALCVRFACFVCQFFFV